MSTNANIVIELPDGKYKSIYVHWDGYMSHTGKKLFEHYNTRELAEAIVDLGNCSFLDDSIECPEGHSFEDRTDGCSVFYGRDRGEDGEEAVVCDSLEDAGWTSYVYVFNLNDEWTMNGKRLAEVKFDD